MSNSSNKTLFICQTPFHLWLVKKIVLDASFEYDILLLTHNHSKKNDYYLESLRKNGSILFEIILLNNNKLEILKSMIELSKNLPCEKEYKAVFVAGINSLFVGKLLSVLSFSELYTYDDGVGNIFSNGVFYNDAQSFIHKFLSLIFNIRYNSKSIKERSIMHYTIYKNFKNISKKLYYINIEKEKEKEKEKKKEIRIFIGQPYLEFYPEIVGKLNTILKKFNILYYYPHPRESFSIEGVDVIESKLIIEDYIFNFIKSNDDVKVIVYGFISTSLINLGVFENVERVALYDEYLLDKYFSLYDLFKEDKINLISVGI